MSQHAWNWTTQEMLPSQLGAEESFMERLLAALARNAWTEHEIFGIRLSVEEAVVNAIKHGNQLRADKQVRIDCRLSRERMWIEVEDQGAGFDPAALPDPTAEENLDRPSGRGVLLMQNFMTRIEYNAVGNCVTMEKQKKLPAP